MIVKDLIKQCRCGNISFKEAVPGFRDAIEPVFQLSEMMNGLDMTWTIGGGEILADIFVPYSENKVELKLYIDKVDFAQIPYGYLLGGKLREPDELEIFSHLLGNGVLIDIGANIGWYSILAGLNGATVYAFEPVEETYQRLCKNIELNLLTSVKTFHIGLGEKCSLGTFYYHKNISGASSRANLDYLSDGLAQPIQCPIETLDHICAQEKIDKIDLIKCDVEGGELFVYQGAMKTIKCFRPYVLSEMLRKWSAKFNYHPDAIIQFFGDLDYKCIALSKKRYGTGYVIERILDTTEETNFLFVPTEKIDKIRSFLNFK